jgi:hypothetical protein
MVFSADYGRIEGGTIDAFGTDGMHRYTLYFDLDVFYTAAP